MIRDYITAVLQDAQLVDNWYAAIEAAKRARDTGDETEQRRQEQNIKALGRQLRRAHEAAAHYVAAVTDSEMIRRKDEVALRTEWQSRNTKVDCLHADMRGLFEKCFEPSIIDMNLLPLYSFVVRFTFRLAEPYLSRDERVFYSIDNPIRKDKTFGLPYVAPSSWKGSLRAALRGLADCDAHAVLRLCGNDKGVDDHSQLRAGRLHFFPTFFTIKSLEIINPHDRRTGAGREQGPILLESVPRDTPGVFSLLYVPFDRVGHDEGEVRPEVMADLRAVGAALCAMFRDSGFGAKTSSGFGVARDDVTDGQIRMLLPDAMAQRMAGVAQEAAGAQDVVVDLPDTPTLPRYLVAPGRLKPEYLLPDGTFRYRQDSEFEVTSGKKKRLDKEAKQEYDKARKWWEREGRQLAETAADASDAPIAPSDQHDQAAGDQQVSPPSVYSWDFASFQDLVEQADKIARTAAEGSA